MMGQARLFVVHLSVADTIRLGGDIEIQLLNSHGQATAVAYIASGCKSIVVGGFEIDTCVVRHAKLLKEGQGAYFDLTGQEVPPF